MCWTASTSPAGSPKASPWYAGSCSAVPPSSVPRHTNRTCSGPASLCCAGRIISQTPTTSIWGACSTLIHVLRTDRDALQELYQLYEAEDLDGANQALGRFADLYATGQIPEYHDIVDTIIAWGEQILAYHTSRGATNGPLEGINNLHPSPTTRRPRVRQPQQLRRPGNPRNTHTCRVFSAGAGLTLLVTGFVPLS